MSYTADGKRYDAMEYRRSGMSGVTFVIVGTSSVAQLDDNLKAVASPKLTDEELAAIDAAMA